MKTLTHPPGRVAARLPCPKCHRYAKLKYHEMSNGRYQHTACRCERCGLDFLKQLEVA